MAAYFESINLGGFAAWMYKQAGEEQAHGKKMFDFLIDRGVKVVLLAIGQAARGFRVRRGRRSRRPSNMSRKSPLSSMALPTWRTRSNDRPTKVFIQWFITEQVEEEKNASRILDLLKKIPPNSAGIFQLDHQLGKRGYTSGNANPRRLPRAREPILEAPRGPSLDTLQRGSYL